MRKAIDMTGKKFGRLTVLERVKVAGENKAHWLCKCDCGNVKIVSGGHLRLGHTQSCGCLQKERAAVYTKARATHGMANTKIFGTWKGLKDRCLNPRNKACERYGGRGIKVCDEWREDFQRFFDYVSNLPHFGEEGYSLDRIDNDGNYAPGNLRFSVAAEQTRNRRNTVTVEYGGRQVPLAEAAELSGLGYWCLHSRYKRGIRGEELFAPPRRQ